MFAFATAKNSGLEHIMQKNTVLKKFPEEYYIPITLIFMIF